MKVAEFSVLILFLVGAVLLFTLAPSQVSASPESDNWNPKIAGWETMVRGCGLEQLGAIDKSEMTGQINSDTVSILWWENFTDPSDPEYGLALTGARIADLDNDGHSEIYTYSWGVGPLKKIYCFHGENGYVKWTIDNFRSEISEPTIADVDNDGWYEIIFGGREKMICVENDGSILWTYEWTDGTTVESCPKVADVDNDGMPEVFFGTTGDPSGRYYLLNAENGTLIWRSDLGGYKGYRGCAVYDLDNNGEYELYIGERHGGMYRINPDNGDIVWGEKFDYGGYHTGPSIADVDNDGNLEMVWSSMGGSSAKVITVDENGNLEASYSINSYADDGVAIFDGDQDGDLEVYCDTRTDFFILNASDLTLENKIEQDGAAASIFICDIDNVMTTMR